MALRLAKEAFTWLNRDGRREGYLVGVVSSSPQHEKGNQDVLGALNKLPGNSWIQDKKVSSLSSHEVDPRG